MEEFQEQTWRTHAIRGSHRGHGHVTLVDQPQVFLDKGDGWTPVVVVVVVVTCLNPLRRRRASHHRRIVVVVVVCSVRQNSFSGEQEGEQPAEGGPGPRPHDGRHPTEL